MYEFYVQSIEQTAPVESSDEKRKPVDVPSESISNLTVKEDDQEKEKPSRPVSIMLKVSKLTLEQRPRTLL